VLLAPVSVTKGDIKRTLFADGFWTAAQVCTPPLRRSLLLRRAPLSDDGRGSRARGGGQALRLDHGPLAGDFHVASAEVVGLVGDNGAGKSTLVKTMAGIHVPEEGEIRFPGKPARIREPRELDRFGNFHGVPGPRALRQPRRCRQSFPGARTGGAPRFARSERSRWSDAPPMSSRPSASGLPSLRIPIALLSGGQRQSVAVARSVMWDAKVVLLDEPTSALGVTQSRLVLDLVARLKEQGLGVVIISHNLADVFSCCDRIVVLRLGRIAASFEVRATRPRGGRGGHHRRRCEPIRRVMSTASPSG